MPRSPKWSNLSEFCDQNSTHIFHFPTYSSFPIISSSFILSSNNLVRVKLMKNLILFCCDASVFYLHSVSFGKVEQSSISKESEYVTFSMPLACCFSSGTDTSTSLPTLRKMQSKLQYGEVTYNRHRDYIFYNNVTLHSSVRKLWHDHIVNTCLSGNKTKRC